MSGKATETAPRGIWIQRSLVILGAILVSLGLGAGFLLLTISAGVESTTAYAVAHYCGDPARALMQLVGDEDAPLRERNRAIWALGRIRETRARPLLAGLYTSSECDHDSALCQHELEKALRRIEDRGRNQ